MPKVRIAEPEEMAIAGQWLSKHIPAAIEELLDAALMWSVISNTQCVVKGK
jgi:hypothetical protein